MKSATTQATITASAIDVAQAQDFALGLDMAQEATTTPQYGVETIQASTPVSVPRTVGEPVTKQPPRPPPPNRIVPPVRPPPFRPPPTRITTRTPPPLPPPPPPGIPRWALPSRKQGMIGGFSALVKRRGKWTKIASGLGLREATLKAQRVVDTTPAASFKITQGDKVVAPLGLLKSRFRPSKVSKGVFVEKRQFRISTRGEKSGITEKGLLALSKKGKKLLFG